MKRNHVLIGAIFMIFVSSSSVRAQEVHEPGTPVPLKRLEWFYSLRRLPDGTIPADGWLRAWEQAQDMPVFQLGDFNPAADPWTFHGPNATNVQNDPTYNGSSFLARVTRISISPSNPNTIYVGATRGGLWKSTNGGTSWTNKPIAPFAAAIGSITLHPLDPNTIYVGTCDDVWFGPGQNSFGTLNSLYGVGLYRSTDGGDTWQRLDGNNFTGLNVNEVIVIPGAQRNQDIILACTSGGIWQSTNGGQTWASVRAGVGTGMIANPKDTRIVLAGIGDFRGRAANGLYISTNNGQTWSRTGVGTLPQGTAVGRVVVGAYNWNTKAHTNGVKALAVSPDGSRVVSGGYDRFLKLWRVENSAFLWEVDNGSNVLTAAYSPDGQFIATGDVGRNVKIWRASNSALVRTLAGHTNSVMSVAYSPDGTRIASGSFDNTVKVWNASTGALITTLAGPTGGVWAIGFSPDNNYLIAIDGDGKVNRWNGNADTWFGVFQAYNRPAEGIPTSLAWARNSTEFATGNLSGKIRRWRPNGTQIGADIASTQGIQSLSYSQNSDYLAAAANRVEVWQLSPNLHYVAQLIQPGPLVVAFSPTSNTRLFSGGRNDNEVSSWALEDNTRYWRISGKRVLYAVFGRPGNQTLTQGILSVWRSDDGGTNWTQVTNPPIPGSPRAQFTWYCLYLKVDPLDYDYAYIGELEIWRTADQGSTWQNRTFAVDAPSGADTRTIVHTDQHTLAFHPDRTYRIYAGNDGGLYYHPNRARLTNSWSVLNASRGTMEYYGMDTDSANSNRLLAGAQDNGVQQRTTGGGQTYNITNPHADGGHTAYKATDGTKAISSYQNAWIEYTTDSGATWTRAFTNRQANGSLTDRADFIAPLANDPLTPARFYVGTFRLRRSTDDGQTFAVLSGDLTAGGNDVLTAIGISRNDSRHIYTGAQSGRVSFSRDDGANWNTTGAQPGNFPVGGIVVDRVDANNNLVYVAMQGFSAAGGAPFQRVFRSVNNGAAWTDISNNLPNAPVNDIRFHPDNNNVLFVATDVGVFVGVVNPAAPQNTLWSRFGTNLPTVPVTRIVPHTADRRLLAATFGRGVWRVSMPTIRHAIYGNVNLRDYVGDRSRIQPVIEIRNNAGQLVESTVLVLDGNGNYVHLTNQNGNGFSVRVKPFHWLSHTRQNVNLNGNLSLNFNVVNGDVNNDNKVDDADLLAVLFAFGNSCDLCPEDLDGNGIVNDADVLIVIFNFGQAGG